MYHRPLDTLLVTVRRESDPPAGCAQIFPSAGVAGRSPDWLDGQLAVLGYGWPLRQLFTSSWPSLCLAGLAALLKYSSLGRRIRATVQNRALAETLGVSTRATSTA